MAGLELLNGADQVNDFFLPDADSFDPAGMNVEEHHQMGAKAEGHVVVESPARRDSHCASGALVNQITVANVDEVPSGPTG